MIFILLIKNMKEEALNIIIGTIISVEKAENSDKLYVVKLNIWDKIIQIATSLASFFDENQLIGKQVPIKIDVPILKIRWIKSEARFIAIMWKDKNPILLLPENKVHNWALVI